MEIDRRSIGRGLLVSGATATLAVLSRAAPTLSGGGTKTTRVQVHPGPGSVLEYDDPEVASVRDALTALLLQNPSCSAGKIGDELTSAHLGAVTETEFPVEYVFRWVNGHWVHDMVSLTQFVVAFGPHRTVLVEVEVTEPK